MTLRTEDLENERYVNLNDLLAWLNSACVEPEAVTKLQELNDVGRYPECGAV